MKILRGIVNSSSQSSSTHSVKVTVPNVCDSLQMDVSNGLYLNPGDMVFVYFADDYASPLVLGKCNGHLEIPDLVATMNNLVDVFNNHTHAFKGTVSGSTCEGTTQTPVTKQTRIEIRDIMYKK